MTEGAPTVSVITPTFNRADFIGETVESILAQTFGDFELLIVDDGSTDNTREILSPYLSDKRLRYFYQENQGQSVARNRGLTESRGQFLCFIDSDNVWLPNKLESQLNFLREHPEVDIVYGDIITIDETSKEIGRENMRRISGHIAGDLLRDNFVSINTSMVRRQCYTELGGFNEKDRLAEDYDLWLRYSTRFKFHYMPEYFAKYRVMDDQISSDKSARFWANERTLRLFLEAYPTAVDWKTRRKGWSTFFARKARYLAGQRSVTKALLTSLQSLAQWPFHSSGWRALFRVFFPGLKDVR